MSTAPVSDLLVPLGTTGWQVWREIAVRGAGFPAERIIPICHQALADAADQVDDTVPATRESYEQAFSTAVLGLSKEIRGTAGDARFREAITWQNPGMIADCLDKAVAGERRNSRGRAHELAIASYLQRYCLKNDTVGFFGPVGWARVDTGSSGLSVTAGPDLLSRRTTYFEKWAIDTLASAIAAQAEVWPCLAPRVEPSGVLAGSVLLLPSRKPAVLSPIELRVFGMCDGRRTVSDIVGDPPVAETAAALLRLRDLGGVRIDLSGPLAGRPEQDLAKRIGIIPDADVRVRALAPLNELIAGRGAVSAAAGDPDRLLRETGKLAETFERITGVAATRRAGDSYAGRTLIYEDTIRDIEIRLGLPVIDTLAAPLGLLLQSATWLANTVAQRYQAMCLQVLDRHAGRTGGSMPLLHLLTTTMPEVVLLSSGTAEPEAVKAVVDDLQRRWQRVLDLPSDGRAHRHHHVSAEAIAQRVAREFATGPAMWSGAHWHSPDIFIAADGPEAVARDDFDFVLGELHCASNTLEYQVFAAQHPAPQRLRDAAIRVGLDQRVCAVPRNDWPLTTSRLSRPALLMLPNYTYLCVGAESVAPPPGATILPAVDLLAQRRGDQIVVHHRRGGDEYEFLEVIGELLTALVVNAFRPLRSARYRPRISIGRLVIGRESWAFAAKKTAWAFVNDEQQRFVQARRWRAAHGITERGFVRVPTELKPVAVDFRSLPLVNLLAKLIRKSAEAKKPAFTIGEMLPDIDRLWLHDSAGARYTTELRFVAVDGATRPAAREGAPVAPDPAR
jgi:hypothetical protein